MSNFDQENFLFFAAFEQFKLDGVEKFRFADDFEFTTSKRGIQKILKDDFFRLRIGDLELNYLANIPVIAFGKLSLPKDEFYKNPDSILISELQLIGFMCDSLWTTKDNCADTNYGFIATTNPNQIWSNNLNSRHTLSDGTSRPIAFNRNELRTARKHFDFSLKHHFDNTPDRFQSVPLLAQKTSTRIERFKEMVALARRSHDLGIKISMYCCALESMYSTDTTESTHKISERCAFFLHPSDGKPRLKTFKTIKYAYSIRSSILHGGSVSNKKLQSIASTSIAVDELARKTIATITSSSDLISLFCESNDILQNFFDETIIGP